MSYSVEDYPTLGYLVAGYFHQDWMEEGASSRDELEHFCRHESAATTAGVVREVERIAAERLTDQELDELLASLDLDYDPSFEGLTNRTWLEQVRIVLTTS